MMSRYTIVLVDGDMKLDLSVSEVHAVSYSVITSLIRMCQCADRMLSTHSSQFLTQTTTNTVSNTNDYRKKL